MTWARFLPEIVRVQPRTELVARWVAASACNLPAGLDTLVHDSLAASHLEGTRTGELTWEVILPWRTLVLGVLPRRVTETVEVRLVGWPGQPQVALSCLPRGSHDAHAVGCAVVLCLALAVWWLAGPVTGIPVALTALAAGTAAATMTRSMALQVLQRRLERLAADLGTALTDRAPVLVAPGHHPPF